MKTCQPIMERQPSARRGIEKLMTVKKNEAAEEGKGEVSC